MKHNPQSAIFIQFLTIIYHNTEFLGLHLPVKGCFRLEVKE